MLSTHSYHNYKPTRERLQAAKHAQQYLKVTIEMALVYEHSTRNGPGEIPGYTDSDWAEDLDDRMSTTRYHFKLASTLITWSSWKQSLVPQSTTRAEYIGCSKVAREAV
jgi:hypothetical protein